MREPKNIADFSKCIKHHRNHWFAWCVECNIWCAITLHASCASVVLRGRHSHIEVDRQDISLICSGCEIDIEYLLVGDTRKEIIYKALIDDSRWRVAKITSRQGIRQAETKIMHDLLQLELL